MTTTSLTNDDDQPTPQALAPADLLTDLLDPILTHAVRHWWQSQHAHLATPLKPHPPIPSPPVHILHAVPQALAPSAALAALGPFVAAPPQWTMETGHGILNPAMASFRGHVWMLDAFLKLYHRGRWPLGTVPADGGEAVADADADGGEHGEQDHDKVDAAGQDGDADSVSEEEEVDEEDSDADVNYGTDDDDDDDDDDQAKAPPPAPVQLLDSKCPFTYSFWAVNSASANNHAPVLAWWLKLHRQDPKRYPLEYTEAALDNASWRGHAHVLDWWFESGLELRYSWAALADAGEAGHVHVLDRWLQAEKQGKLERDSSARLLDRASFENRVAVLDWWVDKGELPTLSGKYSDQAVAVAAARGHLDVLKWWRAKVDKAVFPKSAFDVEKVARSASSFVKMDVLGWVLAHGLLTEAVKKQLVRKLSFADGAEFNEWKDEVKEWWVNKAGLVMPNQQPNPPTTQETMPTTISTNDADQSHPIQPDLLTDLLDPILTLAVRDWWRSQHAHLATPADPRPPIPSPPAHILRAIPRALAPSATLAALAPFVAAPSQWTTATGHGVLDVDTASIQGHVWMLDAFLRLYQRGRLPRAVDGDGLALSDAESDEHEDEQVDDGDEETDQEDTGDVDQEEDGEGDSYVYDEGDQESDSDWYDVSDEDDYDEDEDEVYDEDDEAAAARAPRPQPLRMDSKFPFTYTDYSLDVPSSNNDVAVLAWWLKLHRQDPDMFPLQCPESALDTASWHGHTQTLDWWLDSGLELRYSWSALADASEAGKIESLEWWLQAEKQGKLERDCASRVLDRASFENHVHVLDWWVDKGELPSLSGKYSDQAVGRAAARGHLDVLKWWHAKVGMDVFPQSAFDVEKVARSASSFVKMGVLEWMLEDGLLTEAVKKDLVRKLSFAGGAEFNEWKDEVKEWWVTRAGLVMPKQAVQEVEK